MDDIDVRIHKLSNRLASDPYQIPENTQYITFLPNAEREISPIPESRGFSSSQRYDSSTSPSPSIYCKPSASPNSPAYPDARPALPSTAAKRVNPIFNITKKKASSALNPGGKPSRQTPPQKPSPAAAADPIKPTGGGKKKSSIFLTTSRNTQHHRPVSSAGRSAGSTAVPTVSDISDGKASISPALKLKRYVLQQEVINFMD
jgi:hypothetical protein